MPAVFITNDMLQQWADQGKVRLDDTTLTLLSENRTVKLTPAVRFTKLIDESAGDPNKLLGKVKTKDQLQELGAEHYLDSVIFGDVGYTVVEGFLGDLSPQKRTTSTPPAPDPFAQRETEVKLVAPKSTAPPPVDLPPSPSRPAMPALSVAATAPTAPNSSPNSSLTAATPSKPSEQLSEAEALSRLFLSTVKS